MIMAGFAFHKTAIEVTQVFIIEPFAEAFKAFATAGFNEGEDQEFVEQALFGTAIFFLNYLQLVYIFILSLFSQPQIAFLQFGQYQAEMSPFFGNNRRKISDQFFQFAVSLDQRNTAGSRFLLTICVVGKNVFQ